MKDFDVKKKILSLFGENEGGFVSGEEISRLLGFSRAGVWKHINKLRAEGYVVEAVPHLGYKLVSSPDRMHGYNIVSGLDTDVIGKKDIYYYENIDSTNEKAYELAELGAPEGTLVVAEKQTKGKGRAGRRWVSPSGCGIYLSIILRPEMEMSGIQAITLITALAVIKAVKAACGLEAEMKWPNDVFAGNRKLCGILTEIRAQPDSVDFIVLGIGVNVNTPAAKLPPEGTSLKIECGRAVDRSGLLKRLLRELEKEYLRYKEEGFAPFRQECRDISSVLGRQVKISEHHRSVEGTAVDIDEKGALLVRDDSGLIQRVFSGDVIIKDQGAF